MMSIRKNLATLTRKYGKFSSWAIWCHENEACPSIIQARTRDLHSKYVFVGLNASGKFKSNGPWANFRGGAHDRKLKYACNDISELRGSYLTDMFKGIETKTSAELFRKLGRESERLKKQVRTFRREMKDVGASSTTTFVVLGVAGSRTAEYFEKHYAKDLQCRKVVYYYHYSYTRLTDKKWVEGLWERLGIKGRYHLVRKRY
ncbi:MAG: hypothetical protein NTZ35_07375 [Ignavibacteriales bacterium]|nr:hypothetical protein [Ignavibacteriales bacterium]